MWASKILGTESFRLTSQENNLKIPPIETIMKNFLSGWKRAKVYFFPVVYPYTENVDRPLRTTFRA